MVKKSLLKRRRQWSASEGRYKNAYDDVLREIALMKKLNHPNVIRMHEVLDDPENDKLCIVLDFHSNGALMDTSSLPDEPVTPLERDAARRFFADVVEGLSYLHFQSVVHFDLKPDNVLVSADRRGIIADFGVSRLLESDAERTPDDENANDVLTSGSPGTPMYCAPEVWGDSKYYGKTADVWSLGVTLFVMLLGRTPYPCSTHEQLTEAVCAPQPVELPAELEDESLRDLLARMLDKEPRHRLSLADVASHAWVEGVKPRSDGGLRRQYSRITVNAEDVRAAVTIAGHADSFARDSVGRIVKRTRPAERDAYEAITRLGSGLALFVPPYHGELGNAEALAQLYASAMPPSPMLRYGSTSSVLDLQPSPRASISLPPGERLLPSMLRRDSSAPPSSSPSRRASTSANDGGTPSAEGGGSDGRDVCIVLDDLTVDLTEACLMDIKMGTRTFTEVRRPLLPRRAASPSARAAPLAPSSAPRHSRCPRALRPPTRRHAPLAARSRTFATRSRAPTCSPRCSRSTRRPRCPRRRRRARSRSYAISSSARASRPRRPSASASTR